MLSEGFRIQDSVSTFSQRNIRGYFRDSWKMRIANEMHKINASHRRNMSKVYNLEDYKDIREKVRSFEGEVISFSDSLGYYYVFTSDYILEFEIRKRSGFATLNITVCANEYELANDLADDINEKFPESVGAGVVDFDWYFPTQDGPQSVSFKDMIYEDFFDEAYPFIESSLDEMALKYLRSSSPVLLLFGPPGTGKTKLLRFITRVASEATGFSDTPSVMYISGEETVSIESLFVDFLNRDYDFLVIEDLDTKLKPRSNGNSEMSSLLTSSDGIISSMRKKIMITSNISGIGENDIDPALTRPGRCYDVKKLERLSYDQALNVLEKIAENPKQLKKRLIENKNYGLSDVYYLVEHEELPEGKKKLADQSAGF